ncbi:hypothetical protein ABTE11_21820, partial [Acinetobacter baumannii]
AVAAYGGQVLSIAFEHDRSTTKLLAKVRKRLRSQHGFPRGTKNKFHIDAVFSTEPLRFPELAEGEACEIAPAEDLDVGEDAADSTQAGVTG